MIILGIDPRSKSKDRLDAPAPLPHVSRRALARVKDRIDPPTDCPHCGECVGLVSNAEVYNGREYGNWPYVYLCSGCRAYVGLHPDTDLPLGTLADRNTRDERKHTKFLFKTITDERFGADRDAAYLWLAERMGIEPKACHFGFFDVAQCERAAGIIREALSGRRARP
ncbi:zinc-finger-containing protein [uncultured Castellaniella sp.]|uniref:zinc-finger-containing protein n=1 Tax=uncultured Castellaniella sp. TaxID=647907 RepID=UPI0026346B18|nr:zinc-finger-containing protein [uncultured Castellaniella sp.]